MPVGSWAGRCGRRGVTAAGMVAALAFGMPGAACAASAVLEVTPMMGWQWGGTLDYSPGGTIHANAALNYGGAIGAQIGPGYWGEVSYTYQSTEVIARPTAAPEFKLFDLATHYIQAASARNLLKADPSELKAYPYVMGGLGMTIFSPGPPTVALNTGTQYLFSVSVGGGIRMNMSEKIDLRLQARLLLPMNFESGGFYFGSGGGGVSLSGGTIVPQGEATFCLTFKQAGSATVTK